MLDDQQSQQQRQLIIGLVRVGDLEIAVFGMPCPQAPPQHAYMPINYTTPQAPHPQEYATWSSLVSAEAHSLPL